MAEFWNGYDEGDDEKIIQFLMNGGGLIMGGHSWYWSYSNEDPAHAFPGNRLSEWTGLLVSNQPTSDDVNFDWGHHPLMTPRNAIIALKRAQRGGHHSGCAGIRLDFTMSHATHIRRTI